jgi:hypothetical protein
MVTSLDAKKAPAVNANARQTAGAWKPVGEDTENLEAGHASLRLLWEKQKALREQAREEHSSLSQDPRQSYALIVQPKWGQVNSQFTIGTFYLSRRRGCDRGGKRIPRLVTELCLL